MNPRYDIEKLHFLVVDDHRSMRILVRTILESFGVKSVHEAKDGPAAFKVLNSFPIDMVITDLNMPVMDGVEFVKMVRTSGYSANPYIPIAMLTGFSELPKVVAARDVGVNVFLTKPVSAHALYSKIVLLIKNQPTFIRCKSYVGPDRRRKSIGPPAGVEERRADIISEQIR